MPDVNREVLIQLRYAPDPGNAAVLKGLAADIARLQTAASIKLALGQGGLGQGLGTAAGNSAKAGGGRLPGQPYAGQSPASWATISAAIGKQSKAFDQSIQDAIKQSDTQLVALERVPGQGRSEPGQVAGAGHPRAGAPRPQGGPLLGTENAARPERFDELLEKSKTGVEQLARAMASLGAASEDSLEKAVRGLDRFGKASKMVQGGIEGAGAETAGRAGRRRTAIGGHGQAGGQSGGRVGRGGGGLDHGPDDLGDPRFAARAGQHDRRVSRRGRSGQGTGGERLPRGFLQDFLGRPPQYHGRWGCAGFGIRDSTRWAPRPLDRPAIRYER